MSSIYYAPEKFGLSEIGELDFSSGSYEFDYTVVWKDQDGRLWYGEDSGCSCPSPFESLGVSDLTPIDSAATFDAHLKARQTERYSGYVNDAERRDLVAKVREALR